MKKPTIEHYLVIGIILGVLFSSIPFMQVVEITKEKEYTSDDQNQIEVGFGGPKVTWVTVKCNRTAEIRFMYQDGVWISTRNILLESSNTMYARFNFNGEHSTTVVEVVSEGPVFAHISYTYSIELEVSLFDTFLYSLGLSNMN